jgi:hypothetical protein
MYSLIWGYSFKIRAEVLFAIQLLIKENL